MAPVVKPEVDYFCLQAGINKSLLDLLEGLSPIREDSVVIQGSAPTSNFNYIISPPAKEDNLGQGGSGLRT